MAHGLLRDVPEIRKRAQMHNRLEESDKKFRVSSAVVFSAIAGQRDIP